MSKALAVSIGRLLRVLGAHFCIGFFIWVAIAPWTATAASAQTKRVLVLHSFGRDFEPWSRYVKAIRSELDRQSPWPLDVQDYTLATARFNDPGAEAAFFGYLRALYATRPLDLIISVGSPAANFIQKYRAQLFPQTPLLLTAVEQRRVDHTALMDNDTVVAAKNDFAAVFRNILQVLPDTTTIAVVIGASPLEKFWLEEAQKEAKAFDNRIAFVWYSDFSFEEILKDVSTLPPRSAIFWQLMSVDAAGASHEGNTALRRLGDVANAPIFSHQGILFGDRIVGGPMHSVTDGSRQAVSVAVRILGGEKARDIKIEPIGFAAPIYDWRELQRWSIDVNRLPPGGRIEFREASAWEKYRWQIAAVCAVFLLQAALISGLLYEHARRHFAEVESRRRLTELAHVGRLAVAGELAASIAHEISQPLASILANAETAELMLGSRQSDPDETRQILAEIRRDDQRASEVLRRLRSMVQKAPFEIRDVNLNEMTGEVVGFLSTLASSRGMNLSYEPAETALWVNGDRIQLQQALTNLILNAMDAMDVSSFETDRGSEIVVRTSRIEDKAEIAVSDSGPGIPADQLGQVFEPFFTTKEKGIGMGLSIARTIVQAHSGLISADNKPDGGATFRIALPLDRHAVPSS